ncbi:MAG: TIGR03936 family radical SAM-associated protein [Dehalococcoidales bacterium]|nr:TIGR03936 family radical SAM-associated protein [Dehalococcoidales bacterium]
MFRLRVRFKRGEEIKFISHLDLIRLWQRALHRARLPLAYSKGFSPHPQISMAMPLAIGVTSEAELADIFLDMPVSPHFFSAALSRQLPPGIEILQVHPISPQQPSLQSQTSFAEYVVTIETDKEAKEIEANITGLLSAEHLPWQHQRDTGKRSYDLRVLISDLWLIDWAPTCCTIGMKLRCDSNGAGRPEQVSLALGFSEQPQSIHRTKLILKTVQQSGSS